MASSQGDATRDVDVIVVGAGVLGTFHAYFAAQRGMRVLLLERNAFPNDASVRNFGMLLQTIVETDSEWAGYAHTSRALYRQFQREVDLGVRQSGALYIASTETERQVLREFADRFASIYPCQFLNASEPLARCPTIVPTYCAGGLLFPDDLTAEPRLLLRALIPHLVAQGAFHYQPHTIVTTVERAGSRCFVTDHRGETYSAERVFVCSGADYRLLFPEQLRASGLRVCKLQMMRTAPQPERVLPHAILSGLSILRYPAFRACPSYAALEAQPVDATLREFGVHLLFKQADDGTVIIGDSHEYRPLDEAATLDETTNPLINEAILAYAQRVLDLPVWRLQALWNGYYLTHPDCNVYTETIDGAIHIATGIGGKGMSTGPGFAQAHVAAILG
ncbi:MAG TPA: TIGR03364 family FAD-dependent oxidoreductase [Ktedonobacterales bacterium]